MSNILNNQDTNNKGILTINNIILLISVFAATITSISFESFLDPAYIVNNCLELFKYPFYTYLQLVILIIFLYGSYPLIQKSKKIAFSVGLVLGAGGYHMYLKHAYGCVPDYFPFFGLFYFNIGDVLINLSLLYFAYTILRD